MLNVVILSVVMLNVVILSVVMLNVIILSVVMLNVVVLSVGAPKKGFVYFGDNWPRTRLSHSCSVNGSPMIFAFAMVLIGFFGFSVGLAVATLTGAFVVFDVRPASATPSMLSAAKVSRRREK
jgi:hypothetical protein